MRAIASPGGGIHSRRIHFSFGFCLYATCQNYFQFSLSLSCCSSSAPTSTHIHIHIHAHPHELLLIARCVLASPATTVPAQNQKLLSWGTFVLQRGAAWRTRTPPRVTFVKALPPAPVHAPRRLPRRFPVQTLPPLCWKRPRVRECVHAQLPPRVVFAGRAFCGGLRF